MLKVTFEVSINTNRHLGDSIAILNCLYNVAILNKCAFTVRGPKYIKELFDCFEYTGLLYDGTVTPPVQNNCSICDLYPSLTTVPFLNGKHFKINRKISFFGTVKLPKLKSYRRDIGCTPTIGNVEYFQFDNRTKGNKIIINVAIMEFLLDKFSSRNTPGCIVFGLGGKDTISYLDYDFKLRSIAEIAELLSECRKFIGIDSGLSHLAGTTKVEGCVFINNLNDCFAKDLKTFYQSMYPTLTVYNLKSLLIESKIKYEH